MQKFLCWCYWPKNVMVNEYFQSENLYINELYLFINVTYYTMCVSMCVYKYAYIYILTTQCMCKDWMGSAYFHGMYGGQRAICRSQVSPNLWVQGFQLRSIMKSQNFKLNTHLEILEYNKSQNGMVRLYHVFRLTISRHQKFFSVVFNCYCGT